MNITSLALLLNVTGNAYTIERKESMLLKMSTNRSTPHMRQFAPVKYKKAPQAPRRFKSSYMFFSTMKHKLIRGELSEKGEGQKVSTTEVAKMVSRAWKALPEDEREKWEEMARQDKARYEMEKSMYTGPWKVPATKRVSKDPKAPKRPMSAFLSFSNSRRSEVKNKYKDAKNAEVSRILAQMWKDADEEEKKGFVDEEFALRQKYKIAMSEWKRQSEQEIKTKREERENEAMKAVREGKLPVRNEEQQSRCSSTGGTTDSTASMAINYNTKMASDTFGQATAAAASSYPPVSTLSNSASLSSPAVPNFSFSSNDYSQHSQPQSHSYMAGSSSAYYYSEPQTSPDSYDDTNNNHRNPYGVQYQAHGSNPSVYYGYNRRYDTGTAIPYDNYGQLHPYGYAPQSYYQQGMYNGVYHRCIF
uniref:HMG box domain-containing protein n=1 Tax=Pseudo-nitzschia australis TaxID=44445 RepID=A0A7S4AU04_9STRA|mmetsp:Transcript_25616/g.56158  ORF Transcript_25616/g.56158 Transcript_25616/m.56158 type:complete len:418 (-) Transcript_25616:555-1808(-)